MTGFSCISSGLKPNAQFELFYRENGFVAQSCYAYS